MSTPALKERLEMLKNESEQLKRMVKTQNYNHQQLRQCVRLSEPFIMPEVVVRQTSRSIDIKSPTTKIKQSQTESPTKLSGESGSKVAWSLQKEIIYLRNQNMRLEQNISACSREILELKEELLKLKNKESAVYKPDLKIPFFYLKEQIDVFVSRSPVSQDSYNDMEFDLSMVNLAGDSLRVQQGQVERVFDIKQMTHVDYYDKMIILRFEPKKYWVFLNFNLQSIEVESRWDLGLYINWKTVSSLEAKRLFANEFSVGGRNRKKSYRFSMPISQKTAQYQESQDEDEEPNNQNQEGLQRPFPTFTTPITNQIFGSSPIYIQEEFLQSESNQINIVPLQQEGTLIQGFLAPEHSNRQQKPPSLPETEPKKQSLESIQERAIKSLSKGCIMSKHAKGGINSHQKIVSLSPQTMQLRFQDLKSKDVKSIELKDIYKIRQGELGEGIQKHFKTVNPKLCVLIYPKDGKVVELTGPSQDQVNCFVTDLRYILQRVFSKKLEE